MESHTNEPENSQFSDFPIDDLMKEHDNIIPTMSNREKYNLILPVLLSIASLFSNHGTKQLISYLNDMKEIEQVVRSGSKVESLPSFVSTMSKQQLPTEANTPVNTESSENVQLLNGNQFAVDASNINEEIHDQSHNNSKYNLTFKKKLKVRGRPKRLLKQICSFNKSSMDIAVNKENGRKRKRIDSVSKGDIAANDNDSELTLKVCPICHIPQNAVTDTKLQEEEEFEFEKLNTEKELEKIKLIKEQEFELEKIKLKQQQEFELEKLKINSELELARMQTQNQNQGMIYQQIPETSNTKIKFTLPKIQFRQFGDDLKDWLPFWSQFEHIDKDDDIAPENKFQYLVQATVVGSRAREVVESFPPTGENYAKAVDSLKARFGREDLLVEVYVRELLKLIFSVQSNQKLAPTFLYDKLESYLRSFETLGVTTDKRASILYPMIESCFDEEFLKAWNRSPTSSSVNDAKERLENLMLFLKAVVEGEERLSLAKSVFGLTIGEDVKMPRKKKYNLETQRVKITTASMSLASTRATEVKKPKCIFCDGKHVSSDCFNAQKLTLEEKQKIIRDKNCCFACLLPGHSVRKCRKFLKCPVCSKKHVTLMCDQLQAFKNTNQKKEEEENPSGNDVNLSNVNPNLKVFLQTFKAKLLSNDKEKTVRVLCDNGSQKSYILKNIAEEMKYPVSRQETIKNSLFGGVSTKECKHNCYRIKLKQLNGNFTCNFEVLDQAVICENVLPVSEGPWLGQLIDLGVTLTDTNVSREPIQVLIGADIMGKLPTDKRKLLSSGLVAVETHLGWTLMGKVPQVSTERVNLAMTVTSLFVKEAEIADLWRPVLFNQDNRYEVCLPWADDSFPLPNNFNLTKKRLKVTTEKLLSGNLYDKYENVFQDWLDEGIIEEVPPNEVALYGNYLPHRPVIKESSSTTPIRPVFDASAKFQGHPSLNQCLQCGPNLIELIPDILARFRMKKFGVTADIRKAFLQISVSKEDRDYLRFLWWKNLEEKKLKVFCHIRVVFGVKSSPFLLASVLEYHIEASKGFDSEFKKILKQSFYVDNVVASLDSYEDLKNFISKST
ncbi:hypothetical protein AVEN_190516-1 [Araneus ventricosus]|uniref:Uncharacterized protein n=1 Tax=Araneus ventricosus TaxID=182803 RepID=A0A4Y2MJI9_ARAVE|nr:hypothetical protein AVEN_190516-1 [Araneus ventricosus]